MPLHDKTIELITAADIQALIDGGISEGKNIDYKRELPGNGDAEKKEFLADVSSFANAAGGLLLYGVVADKGLPKQAVGFPTAVIDSEILRLENILRAGIAERIPGLRVVDLAVSPSHSIVVIRIPRSWIGPHMITYKGTSRFFSRDGRGKYQLDLGELRVAFAATSSTTERMRAFRADRIAAIVARETPVRLLDGPATILHVIPFAAMSGAAIDVSDINPRAIGFTALRSSRYDLSRHNFDGLAVTAPFNPEGVTHAYAQLFRSGAIEAVNASMIHPENGQFWIRSSVVETEILHAVTQYIGVAAQLGLDPPYALMVTFTNVKGYGVLPRTNNRIDWDTLGLPLDRDILMIPEVIAKAVEFDSATILRPIFDTLWQSAGWERSMNYDQSGQHIPSLARRGN